MRVTVTERSFALRRPLETAYGSVRSRTVLELALEDADGVVGRGEAAPLEAYDGVRLREVREALDSAVGAKAGSRD